MYVDYTEKQVLIQYKKSWTHELKLICTLVNRNAFSLSIEKKKSKKFGAVASELWASKVVKITTVVPAGHLYMELFRFM